MIGLNKDMKYEMTLSMSSRRPTIKSYPASHHRSHMVKKAYQGIITAMVSDAR